MSESNVVLIHGLAASSLLFRPMAKYLRHRSHPTYYWSYRSFRHSIQKHSGDLADFLRMRTLSSGPLRIVAHSMGCIITRDLLIRFPEIRVSRCVMLAPPNQGSHVAKKLSGILGPVFPPFHELSNDPQSFVQRMPIPDNCEIGIISATRDWVVQDASTRLGSERDHIRINSWHSGLLFNQTAFENVESFLNLGRFQKE